MDINLGLHLAIHFTMSLLAGFLVWMIWKKWVVSFVSAIIGGVLVDFDHFIDYFLAFGINFRLDYFQKGFQFLKNDKIVIPFHGWEYVIALLVMALLLKNRIVKSIMLGLALGLFFHLITDVVIDEMPVRSYSIIYRTINNFDIQTLVYPEHMEHHLREKEIYKQYL